MIGLYKMKAIYDIQSRNISNTSPMLKVEAISRVSRSTPVCSNNMTEEAEAGKLSV